jgi:hypothetical protein
MLDEIEFDDLSLAKRFKPDPPQFFFMNENIIAPVLRLYKAEAPFRIEPLDGAFWHGMAP